MAQGPQSKPMVSLEFIAPDGTKGERSRMKDFETLRVRIYHRIINTIGEKDVDRLVLPGHNAYNSAEYETALSCFHEALSQHRDLAYELQPHVRVCQRVVSTIRNAKDREYSERVERWRNSSFLRRVFRRSPPFKIRCKYCGHFTDYIPPDVGLAYFDTNNCEVCGRGYPAPDFVWDGVDGQAYIYYRHSVREPQFYTEFEAEYDVHPDHTFFLAKKKVGQ